MAWWCVGKRSDTGRYWFGRYEPVFVAALVVLARQAVGTGVSDFFLIGYGCSLTQVVLVRAREWPAAWGPEDNEQAASAVRATWRRILAVLAPGLSYLLPLLRPKPGPVSPVGHAAYAAPVTFMGRVRSHLVAHVFIAFFGGALGINLVVGDTQRGPVGPALAHGGGGQVAEVRDVPGLGFPGAGEGRPRGQEGRSRGAVEGASSGDRRTRPSGQGSGGGTVGMAKIEAATVKGSVFYTGEFTSYNDLSRFGKHVPIDHSMTYVNGPAHIDDLEGFWSYAKGLHRPCHGVDRENFPVYLAEYEFRYTHRDEHLLAVLFDRLYKPEFIKGGLP